MKRFAILGAVLALALASQAEAGRVPLPGSDFKSVAPRGTVLYFETFRGNELVIVEISGSGATDLDLYVYDANNNLVAYGNGLTDREMVTFRPSFTGVYRIEVRNLGGLTNTYQLRTN